MTRRRHLRLHLVAVASAFVGVLATSSARAEDGDVTAESPALAANAEPTSAASTAGPERVAPATEPRRAPTHPVGIVVTGGLMFGVPWVASYVAWLNAEVGWRQRCDAATRKSNRDPYPPRNIDEAGTGLVDAIDQVRTCSQTPDERDLALPLVGPWMTLGHGTWTPAQKMLLVADGVAQATGLGLMTVGAIAMVVDARRGERRTETEKRAARVVVQPGVGASPLGVSAIGVF